MATNCFITNKVSYKLNLATYDDHKKFNGSKFPDGAYTVSANHLNAYPDASDVKFLNFNRDVDITDGDVYYLTTDVKDPEDHNKTICSMHVKLRGEASPPFGGGSNMQVKLSVGDQSTDWTDGEKSSISFTYQGKKASLRMETDDSDGSYDDLRYWIEVHN